MNKIAYDLDGVFIPDCDRIPNLGGLKEFYQLSMFMRPIFTPDHEYDVITARHINYKSVTIDWITKYFVRLPNTIFHECEADNPEVYKAHVLNENPDIQLYIESEPYIVDYLNNNVKTGCKIVLFKDFINNGIIK